VKITEMGKEKMKTFTSSDQAGHDLVHMVGSKDAYNITENSGTITYASESLERTYIVTGNEELNFNRPDAQGKTKFKWNDEITPFNVKASCKEWLESGSTTDGIYTIKPSNTEYQVYCDMTTDGGGWALVAHAHDGSTSSHRNTSAVGTINSPNQSTTAKLSDAAINDIRGSFWNSVIRMKTDDGKADYFRQDRAFNATAGTSSINRVYDTFSNAINDTSSCSGTYNGSIHTGLVGWGCHDYMLYGDNPGMRNMSYQGGTVWVKQI
jgi:hypothetical protein